MTQHRNDAGRERNSVILVDKPAGLTSSDTLNRIKRITGIKKMGHSGTLDKFASGLLVVCTGSATRLTQYFLESDKRYTGQVCLGIETDTCDTEGVVTARCDISSITEDRILSVLDNFRGEILQRPPRYSALKIGGRRASDMARAGEDVNPEERTVTIHKLDVVAMDLANGTFTMDVHCSKGTYIRSLARDIGSALGVYAYLQSLRRVSSGIFHVEEALTLQDLERYMAGEYDAGKAMFTPAEALMDFSTMVLSSEGVRKALNGAFFRPEDVISRTESGKKLYVILDGKKNLIAIADINIGEWQIVYRNVFNSGYNAVFDPQDIHQEE